MHNIHPAFVGEMMWWAFETKQMIDNMPEFNDVWLQDRQEESERGKEKITFNHKPD